MNFSSEVKYTDQYYEILQEYGVSYELIGYYLQIGSAKLSQGWILDISIVRYQLFELISRVVPVLVSEGVAFRLVQNKEAATLMLSGTLGYEQLGKIISIYPESNKHALDLCKKLIAITVDFKGPEIPTNIYLGGCLYTRYGGFNSMALCDAEGNVDCYMYDHQGKLVKDVQGIPFQLPEGIDWPFGEFASLEVRETKGFLNNSYKVTSVLKADKKGSVFKALKLNRFFPKWCIIKEGKLHMSADDEGRDICDRLRWQYELQRDLCRLVLLPKIYDLFSEGNRMYLVMEFIKGKSLDEVLISAHKNTSWAYLGSDTKLILLGYLIQIVDGIDVLHKHGYVHRDITPANFMINTRGKVVMIDLELSYSQANNFPSPPFTLGTEGFMSLEQRKRQCPTSSEDIYGIGGLMIVFFSNLYPVKFCTEDLELLRQDLYFFVRDNDLCSLISRCLSFDAKDRPELSEIRSFLFLLKNRISKREDVTSYDKIHAEHFRELISFGLNGLNNKLLCEPDRMWHSNSSIQVRQQVVNKAITREYLLGIYAGICGVMYFASRVSLIFDVGAVKPGYSKSIEFVLGNFLNETNVSVVPGLFSGVSGVSVALSNAIQNKFIDSNPAYLTIVKRCLVDFSVGLDLANGLAGQGIAVLNCQGVADDRIVHERLFNFVDRLSSVQEDDGSWSFGSQDNGRGLKITGWAHGIAGVLCFLLLYYSRTKDVRVGEMIRKGLRWLIGKSFHTKAGVLWYTNDCDKFVSPWLQDGVSGIALCFVMAYEVFRDPKYRVIAEATLCNHIECPVNESFGMAYGLSGVGQVYLEAFRVFQDEKWKARADWIANLLGHACSYKLSNAHIWKVDGYVPTADFMVGNSGILDFLIRYVALDTLPFPLFPLRQFQGI